VSEIHQFGSDNDAAAQNLEQLAHLLKEVLRLADSENENRLWTPADIANFLQVSEASVMKNYYYMPDFPRGFRLPSKKGMGSRRWYARDIKIWCERQKPF